MHKQKFPGFPYMGRYQYGERDVMSKRSQVTLFFYKNIEAEICEILRIF